MSVYLRVILNAIGIGGGQLALYIATPYIAKIYRVEEFGEYAIMLAYSTLLSSFMSLRYETAILMTSGEQTKKLLHGVVFLSTIIAFISWFVIHLYFNFWRDEYVSGFFYHPVVACALVVALFNINVALYLNQERYFALAAVRIVQPLAMLFLIFPQSFSLIEVWLQSWLLALLFSFFGVLSFYKTFDICGTILELKSFRIYPSMLAPIAALDTAASLIPALFIGNYYGNAVIGNYSQVQRLIVAPIILIIAASGQVFIQLAKKKIEKNESLTQSIINISIGSVVIGLCHVLVVWCCGEKFLRSALAGEWRIDTNYLILIILPAIFRLVVSPLSGILLVMRRYNALILWQTTHFVLTLANGVFHSREKSVDSYLVKIVFLDFVMYVFYYIVIIKSSRLAERRE